MLQLQAAGHAAGCADRGEPFLLQTALHWVASMLHAERTATGKRSGCAAQSGRDVPRPSQNCVPGTPAQQERAEPIRSAGGALEQVKPIRSAGGARGAPCSPPKAPWTLPGPRQGASTAEGPCPASARAAAGPHGPPQSPSRLPVLPLRTAARQECSTIAELRPADSSTSSRCRPFEADMQGSGRPVLS